MKIETAFQGLLEYAKRQMARTKCPRKLGIAAPLLAHEFLLTQLGFERLLRVHGDKDINAGNLAPFQRFLERRWKRIAGTDFAYPYFPNSPANDLCFEIAKILQPHLNISTNKLLMPTLVEHDVTHNVYLENLQLHQFIIADDNVHFIPLKNVLTRAARGNQPLQIDDSKSNHSVFRLPSPAELQRIQHHSVPVTNYFGKIGKRISDRAGEAFSQAMDKPVIVTATHGWERIAGFNDKVLSRKCFSNMIDRLNGERLFQFLNSRENDQHRMWDYDQAMTYFDKVIGGRESEDAYAVAIELRNEIRRVQPNLAMRRLPLVTELVYRTAFNIAHPEQGENSARCLAIAEKMGEHPWGRKIKGCIIVLFAIGFLVTAAAFASVTLGASLSSLPSFMASTVGVASVDTTLGGILTGVSAFIGALAVAAGCSLAKSPEHDAIHRLALRLFKPKNQRDSKDPAGAPLLNNRSDLRVS